MFTGKAPFSAKETGAGPGSRPRPMLAQLKARLPQDLSLTILKAIAREPLQRYRDLQDFLHALGALTITETGEDHQKGVMLFQQEDTLITPIAFSSPSLFKEERRTNEVVTSMPAPKEQPHNKNSGIAHPLEEASSTGRSNVHKIGQLHSIKEWPLIAIAAVIIILSILGTLIFGGLSSASQSNADPPGTPTVHVSTPIQSTLITPTVVVTSTVQPPMGQRVKPNPTPTPTPTFTPTPTPVSPITSGFLSVSPGSFSPANCASVGDHFVCTATLSLSNKATRITLWSTSSRDAGTTFIPAGGFLFPGQSTQITITIPRNCPGNSTLRLITSRATLAIPWSC